MLEPRAQRLEPRAAVRAEARDSRGIANEVPDRAARRVVTERMQIHPSEAAPRRAEHREPCDPVVEVRERAREAEQVLRERLLAERVDLHRVDGQAARAQALAESDEMVAALHEHGDRFFRRALALGRDDLGDTRAFRARVRGDLTVDFDELDGRRRTRRDARAERGRARGDLVDARKHARERLVDPRDDRGRRAEVTFEHERLEPNVSDTALLGL